MQVQFSRMETLAFGPVGVHLSLRTTILTENQGQVGRGHLSLGTMILTVEPGEGSFVSRKNYSNCRTGGGGGGGGGHLCPFKCRTRETGVICL